MGIDWFVVEVAELNTPYWTGTPELSRSYAPNV